ncbi:hypothetical protein [Streptococcus pluranimalium]
MRMSFKTKVLMELKDYDDDILVGTTVGTTFHWTIGLYTSSLFRKYFDDGCVVTVKHLKFLVNLEG